jgi:hypothetical protein
MTDKPMRATFNARPSAVNRSGKSTAARAFSATLNPNLYKILYVHSSSGSALDLLRQVALELNLEPAHGRGDLGRQIAEAVVRLNQGKSSIYKAASHSHHRRSATAASSGPGATPAAAELLHGLLPLPDAAAHRSAFAPQNAFPADVKRLATCTIALPSLWAASGEEPDNGTLANVIRGHSPLSESGRLFWTRVK